MTVNQMISGVVVFEADTSAPKRIAARYYEQNSVLAKREAQIAFEKDLISKAIKSCASLSSISSTDAGTRKSGGDKDVKPTGEGGTPATNEVNEVVLVDNFIVILRLCNDVLMAVIARDSQNDLLIAEYLNTLHSCVSQICGGKVSKKKCFDRLDQLFLVIDESIENGVVFEYDSSTIVSRINMVSETVESADGNEGANNRPISASTAMRQGIAAIRSGDTDSLRSVFAGAAQSFSSFLGR